MRVFLFLFIYPLFAMELDSVTSPIVPCDQLKTFSDSSGFSAKVLDRFVSENFDPKKHLELINKGDGIINQLTVLKEQARCLRYALGRLSIGDDMFVRPREAHFVHDYSRLNPEYLRQDFVSTCISDCGNDLGLDRLNEILACLPYYESLEGDDIWGKLIKELKKRETLIKELEAIDELEICRKLSKRIRSGRGLGCVLGDMREYIRKLVQPTLDAWFDKLRCEVMCEGESGARLLGFIDDLEVCDTVKVLDVLDKMLFTSDLRVEGYQDFIRSSWEDLKTVKDIQKGIALSAFILAASVNLEKAEKKCQSLAKRAWMGNLDDIVDTEITSMYNESVRTRFFDRSLYFIHHLFLNLIYLSPSGELKREERPIRRSNGTIVEGSSIVRYHISEPKKVLASHAHGLAFLLPFCCEKK